MGTLLAFATTAGAAGRALAAGPDASWQAVKASAGTASDTNLFMNSPEKQEWPEYRRNHRLEPMAQLEVRLFMKEPAAVAARGCRFDEETAWKRMQTYDSTPARQEFFFRWIRFGGRVNYPACLAPLS